jgi:hypothetical protein
MAGKLSAGVPSAALVDEGGGINPVWRSFLLALYARTGGPTGATLPAASSQVTAEMALRAAADAAEAAARQNGDGAEAAARVAADTALAQAIADEAAARRHDRTTGTGAVGEAVATLTLSLAAEVSARVTGDTLAHIVALAWAGLPTVDPGGNVLWVNDGVLMVGSPARTLGLEDGTGAWLTEDGATNWGTG